ncbi:MAG TPA: helix-turn-helix domain-containing protein [Pirellulales bacterium]|nr:helix-turn-helix domain-containing protein [Pirellulales bacterium]
MKATLKLSSEERRAAIVKAVRRVFAEKGFHGTTTRELAIAAEVSEALLFKHFPNKEALYSAMLVSCCNHQDPERMARLKTLEPSASTLVLMVHLLVSKLVGGRSAENEDTAIQVRLVLRSLMEDGEFAMLLLQRVTSGWLPKVEECIKAAIAAGDAVETPAHASVRAWLTHHLAVMLLIFDLPPSRVVDYGISREQLVEQAVWFSLRGMGLKEDVIRSHYNAKALALFGN